MPPKETLCIDLGGWIVAFYAVYIVVGIAAFSVACLLTNHIVHFVRGRAVAQDAQVSAVAS
jgi:hypothetical protein